MKPFLSSILAMLICFCSYGQQAFTSVVNFEFTHSLRIPNHRITIDIAHIIDTDTVIMHVRSSPMNDDREWVHTKVDTTYIISSEEFNLLKELVFSISSEDIKGAMIGGGGTDGTICRISFGDSQNQIIYQVWTPDYDVKKRKLERYMEVCKMILKMAGFRPKKIF